ncbi:hypothetical protein [Rhodopseudomonas palustris]|uniref:hypothetical protein n=1 Tax=Rhodopseudomonas palustris TaxID=1076 RepID=UPI0011C4ABB4|nr:hypothetical protein [Rhodopseudomonas palustris]
MKAFLRAYSEAFLKKRIKTLFLSEKQRYYPPAADHGQFGNNVHIGANFEQEMQHRRARRSDAGMAITRSAAASVCDRRSLCYALKLHDPRIGFAQVTTVSDELEYWSGR